MFAGCEATGQLGTVPTPDDSGEPGLGDTADTAALDTGALGSRCAVDGAWLECDHETTTLFTGLTGLVPRDVHWQVPLGAAPQDGWPVVVLFQGSLFPAGLFWVADETQALGYRTQVELTRALLDGGFAVVTPEAHLEGGTFWDTNVPPMSVFWEQSSDNAFMLDLFDAMQAGQLGPLDLQRWYASGISSGGYMTSRMALSYPGRFRALAVQSASWATCAGVLCQVPSSADLPANHPPTLFLHGQDDTVVPLSTMEPYHDRLATRGVTVDKEVQPGAGHAWNDIAPTAIPDWFRTH